MNWNLICQDVRYDEPMSRHTSFGIGGPAEVLLRPHSRRELLTILENEPNAFVFGNGTNLLVADAGIRSVVVSTAAMRSLTRLSETRIECECGTLLSYAASFAWKLGLSGLEFAAGIPGTLGGAIYMNAGAYGGEMADTVVSSLCLRPGDGEVTEIFEHDFSYRDSLYKRSGDRVILSAVLELENGDIGEIRAKMDDYAERRKSRQPLEWPSAGSVFKRPEGAYAGALIEEAGLKGLMVGGAQVSEKHAGFIINRGDATCEDVRRLIGQIQSTVLQRTGIALEPEIRMVGV